MPEHIITLYGKIGEGKTGILEMRFNKNTWETKVDGDTIRLIRKGM